MDLNAELGHAFLSVSVLRHLRAIKEYDFSRVRYSITYHLFFSAEIFNFLSDLPTELDEFELLDLTSFEDVSSNSLEKHRKRFYSKVLNDGSVSSLKCRRVKKRDVKRADKNVRGASVLKSIFGDFKGPDDLKSKNIRQTGEIIKFLYVLFIYRI